MPSTFTEVVEEFDLKKVIPERIKFLFNGRSLGQIHRLTKLPKSSLSEWMNGKHEISSEGFVALMYLDRNDGTSFEDKFRYLTDPEFPEPVRST